MIKQKEEKMINYLKGVKGKIIIPIILILFLVFISSSFIIIIRETEVAKNSIYESATSFSSLSVTSIVKNYELYYDSGFLKYSEIIDNLMDLNQNVKRIQLINIDGKILFDSNEINSDKYSEEIYGERFTDDATKNRVGLPESSIYEINSDFHYFDIIQPYIEEWGRHDYSVRYYVSLASLDRSSLDVFLTVILNAFLSIIVTYILIYLLLKKIVISPISKLTNVVRSLSSEGLGHKVDINSGDEFGELASSFNIMSQDLLASREILEDYNKNLEEKILIRTKELKESRDHLKLYVNKLTENKNLLNSTIESTADGILVVDNNGKVIFSNSKFAEMWYIPKNLANSKSDKKLLDHVLSQLKSPEEFVSKVNKLYKSSETDFDTIYFKDGRIFERYSCPLLKNKKISGRVWSFRDITRHKMALNELNDAHELLFSVNKQLERKVEDRTARINHLIKQKDEFINILGHDLKTPLTPIMALVPMIIENPPKDPEQIKQIYDVIMRNIQYMKELVNSTIELAKLNSDKTDFLIEEFNLLSEVDEVVKINEYIFKKNKIIIENKIDKDINVFADNLRLKEVLNNLLINAVKYSKEEGGKIILDASEKKKFIKISISDNGIGMNKDQIGKIFDEFYKVDNSRHDLTSHGLGLPICKQIVEKHGGKIWAESAGSGKGSIFYFTLPSNNKKLLEK